MIHTDYTKNILNIKDENIRFYKNSLESNNINGTNIKFFKGFLTNKPSYCPNCGVINEFNEINKYCNISNNTKLSINKLK